VIEQDTVIADTPQLKEPVKLAPIRKLCNTFNPLTNSLIFIDKANPRNSLTVLPTIIPTRYNSPKSSILIPSNNALSLPKINSPTWSPKVDSSFLTPNHYSSPNSATKVSPTSLTVIHGSNGNNGKSSFNTSSKSPKLTFSSLSKKYLHTRS